MAYRKHKVFAFQSNAITEPILRDYPSGGRTDFINRAIADFCELTKVLPSESGEKKSAYEAVMFYRDRVEAQGKGLKNMAIRLNILTELAIQNGWSVEFPPEEI